MTAQAGDTFLLKQTLRRDLRARRFLLPAAQRARAAEVAADEALHLLQSLRVRRVAIYLAYGAELDTGPLRERLHRAGITVAVPRMRGHGAMRFEQLDRETPLRRNRRGIREPAGHGVCLLRRHFDAVLLPLLGFDRSGGRLGAGGGYYDRWLARPRIGRRPLLLGYAYALQEIERVPVDAWDVKLDAVITEQGVRWLTG